MTSEAFDPARESAVRDDLVAYLDGELSDDETRRIEELMASDPRVRQELQRLERTWDLLDGLPKAEVDRSFTSTTVEMIALKAEGEASRERTPGRLRMNVLTVALMAAAMAIGFFSVSLLRPDPNRQFLRDLH